MVMVGRSPWTRYPAFTNTSSRPTWTSAADQGVRPTLRSMESRAGFRTAYTNCKWTAIVWFAALPL